MKRFDYFEIRAAVDDGQETRSFLGQLEHCPMRGSCIYTAANAEQEALEYAATVEGGARVFWTIYGRFLEDGCSVADAIGDFDTFAAALECLNAILAPMAAARDLLETAPYSGPVRPLSEAAALLDDVINQSTTQERL